MKEIFNFMTYIETNPNSAEFVAHTMASIETKWHTDVRDMLYLTSRKRRTDQTVHGGAA